MTSAAVTAFCLVGGHERLNLVSIVFISVFSSQFPLQKPPSSIIKLVMRQSSEKKPKVRGDFMMIGTPGKLVLRTISDYE